MGNLYLTHGHFGLCGSYLIRLLGMGMLISNKVISRAAIEPRALLYTLSSHNSPLTLTWHSPAVTQGQGQRSPSALGQGHLLHFPHTSRGQRRQSSKKPTQEVTRRHPRRKKRWLRRKPKKIKELRPRRQPKKLKEEARKLGCLLCLLLNFLDCLLCLLSTSWAAFFAFS